MDSRAFTLMELLVVIVILGLVAGMAVPSYQKTVEASRSNEAVVNLNIINMAEKIYALNHGGNYLAVIAAAGNIGTSNTAPSVDMSAKYYTKLGIAVDNGADPKQYTAKLTKNTVDGGNGATCLQTTFLATDTTLQDPPVACAP